MQAMTRKFWWLLLPLWLLAKPALAAEAVAMVTDLGGEAMLAENGSKEKLQLLAYLMPGAEIEAGKDARVVITYFASSEEFAFSGPAKVRIGDGGLQFLSGNGAAPRKLAQGDANAARKFSSMQREKLAQATYEMRGAMPGLRLIGPVDTAVATLTPEFAWSAPGDATSFQFELQTGGKTVRRFDTAQSSWQVPTPSILKYGRSYHWKVETRLASGEMLATSGSFSVLNRKRAEAIVDQRPSPDAEFSKRVLYAMRLEAEGLKYEARAAWRALALERPEAAALREQAIQ